MGYEHRGQMQLLHHPLKIKMLALYVCSFLLRGLGQDATWTGTTPRGWEINRMEGSWSLNYRLVGTDLPSSLDTHLWAFG